MERIGMAIAGYSGSCAWTYASLLSQRPEARLVAVWDEEPAQGREVARRFQTASIPEYEKMVLDTEVQAVIVASPLPVRAQHAMLAAEAGKDVLCEAPLALTLEEADGLLNAVRRSGVTFQPSFPARYSQAAVIAEETLRRGEVGELIALSGVSRPTEEECPVGGLAQLMDLLRWFSRSDVEFIYAVSVREPEPLGSRRPGLLAVARLRSRAMWSLDSCSERLLGSPADERLVLRILGAEGFILLDLFSQVITVCGADGSQESIRRYRWRPDLREQMIHDFLSCVRQPLRARADVLDGRQATELCIAAQRSASERRLVRLPLGA